MPGLFRAEQGQVNLANKLLRAALFLFVVCLQAGAPAVLEHPAFPDAERAALSIWKPQEVDALIRHGATPHRIDQCM
eukprot:8441209-Lingulodinium_polyedra.AAC.1